MRTTCFVSIKTFTYITINFFCCMKKIGFILMLCCISWLAFAAQQQSRPKFHVFVVGMTFSPSSEVDFRKVQATARVIADIAGLDLVLHTYETQNTSSQTLYDDINNLKCTSDDAVWFYFSGHGLNSSSGNGKFPMFVIASDNGSFSQEGVHRLLRSKQPRLLITMFDACNYTSATTEEEVLDDSKQANYIKLFGLSKGDIKLASNTAGQGKYSYADDYNGGFLTNSFLIALEKVTGMPKTQCTWDALLEMTKSSTIEMAQKEEKMQTPYFEHNILYYQ